MNWNVVGNAGDRARNGDQFSAHPTRNAQSPRDSVADWGNAIKLPRWLVIAMLTTSVLAVLATAGWWWVAWPERTAERYARFLWDGKYQAARKMCAFVEGTTITRFAPEAYFPPDLPQTLQAQARTLAEFAAGRASFKIHGKGIEWELLILRGRVLTPIPWVPSIDEAELLDGGMDPEMPENESAVKQIELDGLP